MNTTISISREIQEKIQEFGNKGDTYSDILLRLYNSAKERQLQDILMDEKDTLSVELALKKAKTKWSK